MEEEPRAFLDYNLFQTRYNENSIMPAKDMAFVGPSLRLKKSATGIIFIRISLPVR